MPESKPATRKLSRTKRIYCVGPVECDHGKYDPAIVTATSPEQAREIAYELGFSWGFSCQQAFLTAEVMEIGKAYEDVTVGVELGSLKTG